MPTRPIDISGYAFTNRDELLFDANVWLCIYGTHFPPADWRVAIYSNAYSRALQARCRIYLDLLVVSEFINRYGRLIHQLFTGVVPDTPTEYKAFRQSANFNEVAQQIASDLKRIIPNCSLTECNFPKLNVDEILQSFELGKRDFNDLILEEVCKAHNLILVTHDADVKGTNATVLTANKKLLAAR